MHPMWKIRASRGKPPHALEGLFTAKFLAVKAIQKYAPDAKYTVLED